MSRFPGITPNEEGPTFSRLSVKTLRPAVKIVLHDNDNKSLITKLYEPLIQF